MARDNSLTESPEALQIPLQDIVESSRIITETVSDAIITINENSRILFVNRAAVNIFGYSMEEMVGADFTMLMPEYLRQLHRAGLKNYLETGQKHIPWVAVELPGLHKSGQEISLELSFGEFHKDGQRFFTGIARDITKRKLIEKRLAALQKVTDSALAHLSLDELLSESLNRIREVLNVDTVAVLLLLQTEGNELVAWAGQGLEEEVELGVRIPVGRGFAGKIVAEGQPIIIDDVSQADVFNPLLREKGISELRTPLTPIIGWAHMMQNGIVPDAEFQRALSVISRNAFSLKRLINDLLDMSAILTGKMRLEETYLSLADVLSESVETMRSYARYSKVDLRLEIADGASPLIIKGDRTRLSQTFCNILHNAVKFSPPGSYVQVRCEASDSEATVRITDQGEGVPPEFLPYVFEHFRQADGSRSRAYGGLGLGLALVKSFVAAHGGTIEAASDGAGKGSVFVVKLPRAAAPRGEIGR